MRTGRICRTCRNGRTRRLPALGAAVLVLWLAGCSEGSNEKTGGIDFLTRVKPVLVARCLNCHNTETLLGELNLETRALAFRDGPKGPFIVPGKPEESRLYTATLAPEEQLEAMPPSGHRLSEKETDLLRRWIKEGAPWPDGADGTLHPLAPQPAS